MNCDWTRPGNKESRSNVILKGNYMTRREGQVKIKQRNINLEFKVFLVNERKHWIIALNDKWYSTKNIISKIYLLIFKDWNTEPIYVCKCI